MHAFYGEVVTKCHASTTLPGLLNRAALFPDVSVGCSLRQPCEPLSWTRGAPLGLQLPSCDSGLWVSFLMGAPGPRGLGSIPRPPHLPVLCGLGQPLAFSEPLFPHLRIRMKIKGDTHKSAELTAWQTDNT